MGNSKRKWDDTYDNERAGRCQDELMRAQARRRSDCSQLQAPTEAHPLPLLAAAAAAQPRPTAVVRSVVLSDIGARVRPPVKRENFITEAEALALSKPELRMVWARIYGRCCGRSGVPQA
jgi:hypothetical protein